MELCGAGNGYATVEQWLRVRPKVVVDDTIQILIQVSCALDWIHRHGVVHRDVKPANLFITHDRSGLVPYTLHPTPYTLFPKFSNLGIV